MPELPDLTVFAENLEKMVARKKITAVSCQKPSNCNVPPGKLAEALCLSEITGVERWGKQLCFRFDNGNSLCVHLMLTGGFIVTDDVFSIRFPFFTLTFADRSSLVVTDPKGWAKAALNPPTEAAPDALDVTAEHLGDLFAQKPKLLAKTFLLDQKLLRGLGNAYADEILWEARISPKSTVGKLPPEAVERLAGAIPAVLSRATETLRKRTPPLISGEVRDFLAVHNPSRSVSPTGKPILKEEVGGKTTYFTAEQELYR